MAVSPWILPVALVAFTAAEGATRVALAAEPLEGTWNTPLGRVRIEQTADGYLGKLQDNAPVCGFTRGAEVLRGRVADDLFTGELRVCFRPGCGASEAWVLAMAAPVEDGNKLVGAVAPARPSCANSVTEGRPFAFARRAEPVAAAGPRARRAIKAEALAFYREGHDLATAGNFEAARRKLERAERLDPANPEILKEIGITYYARRDFGQAEKYYLSAIKYDADFIEAHYNLACARALRGERHDALASLRRAVDLGYGAVDEMAADHDLDSLRTDPAYQEILRLARANAGRRSR